MPFHPIPSEFFGIDPASPPPGPSRPIGPEQWAQRIIDGTQQLLFLPPDAYLPTQSTEDHYVFADTGEFAGSPSDLNPVAGPNGTLAINTGSASDPNFRDVRLVQGTPEGVAQSDVLQARLSALQDGFQTTFGVSWEDFLNPQPTGGPRTVPITIPVAGGGSVTLNVSPDTAASIAQRGFEFSENLKFDLMKFNNLSERDIAELEQSASQFARGETRLDIDLAFRINDAQARLGIAQQDLALRVQGLGLQRAGLEITALADDWNRLAQIGQLTYQEVATNLSRIDTALNQRRASREELYRFAVTEASLIQRGGETLTRLPFSEQIAMALSGLSGGPVSPEQLDLPITRINPEAEGQAVVDATEFTSPIPGLQQAARTTGQQIERILGGL